VGCGNLIRGDDAAGPVLVRLLAERGVPVGVRLVDGGTAGMDVAFALRGARRAIVVDASRVGVPAGTVHRVPGEALVDLRPPEGNLHRFRWDQALGFAQWLLGADYPQDVTVWLVEGESFEPGAPLSPPVQAAVERVAGTLMAELGAGGSPRGVRSSGPAAPDDPYEPDAPDAPDGGPEGAERDA
jgi:hydrogenase maturation protease